MTLNGLKRRFGVIICLQLAFQLILSQASFAGINDDSDQVSPSSQNNNPTPWNIPPTPELPLNILQKPSPNDPSDSDLNQIDTVTPQIGESAKKWADERESTAGALLAMRAELFDKLEAMDNRYGVAKTNEAIRQGNPDVVKVGLGRMKLTVVDNVRLAVFFEDATGRATIIYNRGELDPSSRQLKDLIAGYHVAGNKTGRDVILMELNDQMEPTATENNKPKITKEWRRWVSDRFYHYYKHPDLNDNVLGIASGVGQGLATFAISAIKTNFDNGTLHLNSFQFMPHGLQWFPVLLAAGFGTVMGIYNRAYTNYAYDERLSSFQQTLRQLPTTVAYSSLMMLHTGGHGIHEHFWSISFFCTNLAQFFFNKTFISNTWNKSLALRTKLQENAGRIRFSVFGKDLALRQDTYERSTLYLVPFTFKNTDYFLRSFENFKIAVGNSVVQPVLPLAQLVGSGLAYVLHIWYLKRLADRPVSETWSVHRSEEMKAAFDKSIQVYKDAVVLAAYPDLIPLAAKYLKTQAKASAVAKRDNFLNNCSKVFSRLGFKGRRDPQPAVSGD